MLNKYKNNKFESRFKKAFKITDFEFGLISKDIEKYHFINYADSQDDEAYNYILDYYVSYLSGDYSFINYFDFDDEGISPGYRADRLFGIIKEIQKIKYTNKDCKHILNLFFSYHNDNLKLILVDLYHLGIYGTRYIDGKINEISIERKYKHHKRIKTKVDLADIKLLNK